MTGEVLTLPRWLRVFFLAVAEAPWTNIKIFNSLVATNATLMFLGVAALFQLSLNESLVDSVLIFLASWLGIAMIGQIGKRATYKPSPPYGPDVEDAQAGATVTPPKPVAPATPAPPVTFGGKSQ